MNGNGPQKENGYTAIANEIMEHLALAPLRGQQMKCVLFLLRRTYGYHKKDDRISLNQWAEGTNMKRQNVWRELHLLVEMNVIYMKSNGEKRSATWGFNKHYDTWKFPSVITDDYSADESVITDDYRSVITPHESTKERKKSSSSAAAAKGSTRNVSEFVMAYERIWGMMVASDYIGKLIQEWESRVTLEGWSYALEESIKSKNQGNWKYFTRILERIERDGYQPKTIAAPTLNTVDFAIEDIYQ